MGVSCVYIYRGVCDGDIGVPPCPAGGQLPQQGEPPQWACALFGGARTPAPAEGGHSRSEVNIPPPVW